MRVRVKKIKHTHHWDPTKRKEDLVEYEATILSYVPITYGELGEGSGGDIDSDVQAVLLTGDGKFISESICHLTVIDKQ